MTTPGWRLAWAVVGAVAPAVAAAYPPPYGGYGTYAWPSPGYAEIWRAPSGTVYTRYGNRIYGGDGSTYIRRDDPRRYAPRRTRDLRLPDPPPVWPGHCGCAPRGHRGYRHR